MHSAPASPARRRITAGLVALFAAAASNGCALKDSDFFSLVEGQVPTGSIEVVVFGAPAVDVQITGPGTNENRRFNGSLGGESHRYGDLTFGVYTVTAEPGAGFVCDKEIVTVTLDATNPDQTVEITCEDDPPDLATLTFLTTGFTGSATYPLTLSGDVVRTGQFGASGVVFDMVPGGSSINWMLDLTGADQQCAPNTGSAVVPGGENVEVTISCEPLPGTVQVQVLGLGTGSASVDWVGAASGSGAFGAVVSDIPDLPAGSYTFTITDPAGFECSPPTQQVVVPAGGSVEVQFACVEEEPEELQEYAIDLDGFQGAPGAVASGTYSRPVRDALLVAVANIAINTIGLQTFYGISPFRLGFDGSSGYELDTFFQVAALSFAVRFLQVCTINAALSGSNFLALAYYSTALTLLGTASITSSPGCFWLSLPPETRFIRMLGPALGFVDIYNLRLRGVLQ